MLCKVMEVANLGYPWRGIEGRVFLTSWKAYISEVTALRL